MIGTILAASALLATQNWELAPTVWNPPSQIEYRMNFPVSSVWALNNTAITQTQQRFALDRACVIWDRVGILSNSTTRCRATGNTSVNPLGDFKDDGWNLGDGVNSFAWVNRALIGSPQGVAASTWCDPPTGFPQANACDVWLGSDFPWTADWSASTGTGSVNFRGTWGGSIQPFQLTVMHEAGHSLGIFHPTTTGSFLSPQVLCGPSSYNCPVMSAGSDNDSWWPSEDDYQALLKKHSKLKTPRKVEVRTFKVNASNKLQSITGWSQLGGLKAHALPRISCRPGPGSGNNSCVMAIAKSGPTFVTVGGGGIIGPGGPGVSLESAPQFYRLDVTGYGDVHVASTSPSITAPEGPVDIAYGSAGTYLALGKIPVDAASSPARVTAYAGIVGGSPSEAIVNMPAPVNGSNNSNNDRTHTEPRVSFNDLSCTYLGAWPNRQGQVVVASFDLSGAPISSALLDGNNTFAGGSIPIVNAQTPVEVSCPNHVNPPNSIVIGAPPPVSSTCKIYVQDADGSQNYFNGRFKSYDIEISHGGTTERSCTSTTTKGNILGVTPDAWSSTSADALIVDATRWNKSEFPGTQGFMITTDRSQFYTSMTKAPVRVRLDYDGDFNGSIASSTLWSMNNSGESGMTNLTSWGWNETYEMFVAVRLGDYAN